jgi:hypothetical protein
MWSSPLLDQLIELSKEDWSRLCQREGSEEEARWHLRDYSRRYRGPYPPVCDEVCERLIGHFSDVYRDRLIGRRAGHPETEKIPPDLVRLDTLRLGPDEIITKDGVTYVDVQIRPALQIPDQASPGPKPGNKTAKDQASEIAESILSGDAPDRPPRGYGRMIALARLIQPKLAQRYKEDSIQRMISKSVREWEKHNPN